MKRLAWFFGPHLFLLFTILWSPMAQAQWSTVRRLLPSVFTTCKAESLSNDNYLKNLKSDYTTVSNNIFDRYQTAIEDFSENKNIDLRRGIEDRVKGYLGSAEFRRYYNENKILNYHAPQFHKLMTTEVVSLRTYTGYMGSRVNRLLEMGSFIENSSLDEQGYLYVLDGAIERSDKWTGIVYRGVKGVAASVAQNWEVGDVVEFKGYTSTTKDLYVAQTKFTKIDQSIVLKINNAKGVSIESVSVHPEEKEILIARGSKFEVLNKVVQNNGRFSSTTITLNMLESDEPKPVFEMEYESTGTFENVLAGMSSMGTSVSPKALLEIFRN